MIGELVSVLVDRGVSVVAERGRSSRQDSSVVAPFLAFTGFVIVSYGIALEAAARLGPAGMTPSAVTFPLTILWFGAAWLAMRATGLPLASYGVTWRGWRTALPQALHWTLVGCVAAVLLKVVLISTTDAFADEPLLKLSGFFEAGTTRADLQFTLALAALYAITAPLQEFIVRAGLQTAMQRMFGGGPAARRSIVLSNTCFAVVHIHLSLGLAVIAFLAGLLWGSLFARQRHLAGVAVCHLLVGWFAFLIVGFEPWY